VPARAAEQLGLGDGDDVGGAPGGAPDRCGV